MNNVSMEQRIASVLAGDAITSFDLSTLMQDVEAAADDADATAEAERTRALDPAQPVDLATVHGAMERAAITAERLRAAMPRLWAKFDQITSEEYATQWRSEYAAVEAASDALATELNETYPAIVATISDLMTRIAACDQQVAKINSGAPSGEPRRLRVVELQGRNLDRFSRAAPSILDELRLPMWEAGGPEWPMARPFNAAAIAAVCAPRPFDRRYSPDWWQVKEEEARALRERQEREAAEREAKALENYHGPRWWEKERA